jgi:hypothetical protein
MNNSTDKGRTIGYWNTELEPYFAQLKLKISGLEYNDRGDGGMNYRLVDHKNYPFGTFNMGTSAVPERKIEYLFLPLMQSIFPDAMGRRYFELDETKSELLRLINFINDIPDAEPEYLNVALRTYILAENWDGGESYEPFYEPEQCLQLLTLLDGNIKLAARILDNKIKPAELATFRGLSYSQVAALLSHEENPS